MTAGLNKRVSIWRMNEDDDDSVGGAQITGSLLYQDVLARIEAKPVQQLLIQQGLETNRTFSAVIVPGTISVRERDELQVIYPPNDPYYNNRFRIVSMSWSNHNQSDPRAYIMLDLTRSVRSHAEQ